MTDNNHSSFEHSPLPAQDPPSEGRLVTTSSTAPLAAPPSAFAPPASHDVLSGGIDASTLLHAFRRRWLLASGMGLLAGAIGAAVLWALFPPSATAYKLYQVDSSQNSVLNKDLSTSTNDYDIYRKSQLVQIKSPRVLDAALRSGDLDNNSFFDGVEEFERMRHLQEELQVSFLQDSEILEIRLSGAATSDELKAIVEAVGKAYLDEILFEEKLRSKKPRDILAESYQDLDEELRRKREALVALQKDSGSSDYYIDGDPEVIQLRSNMIELGKKVAGLEAQLSEASMNYAIMKRQYEDPAVLEQRIDQAVEADPEYQYLKQKQLGYKMYAMDIASMSKGKRSSQVAQYERLAGNISQQMDARRQQISAGLKQQYRTEPDPVIKSLSTQFGITQAFLTQQIKQAQEEQEEILETLRDKGQVDTEMLAREAEIQGLQMVQSRVAERIEHWDVELHRPERVREASAVDTSDQINIQQRYAIAGVGGLACLGLTMFGIAYLEFCNRKLNGPDQMERGLGIRVIGTLPSLSGRKALNPAHPVVAQLTESIDGVRTALMHESTTRRRQIVMVTSPSTLEGRTTVASQLAASLARAGRRTLLIDGDLRHPALHSLFDLPLEDGLCEVLRAEAEVGDVVRPTHAEGLWVLTAGYCDADAIHALATDQVQPIFEKLRSEYDFIIIDGAPVLGLSDSLLFGQHCDGAILSVLRDHTSLPKIHQSAELLRNVGIRLIGSVVNGVQSSADRRVTALQSVTSKSERKQLESAEA